MKHLYVLLSGMLFGAGLALSGLTDPDKVQGFLDLAGDWNPGLLWVMVAALLTTMSAFWLIRQRAAPVFAPKFLLPASTALDGRLLLGAALFGIGWGLAGLCPGPALAGLTRGTLPVAAFVGAMLAGMAIAELWIKRKTP